MAPLVSILIPLYNKAAFVSDTLASVQNQEMSDWEAIVVDNGSTDDGPAQVAALARHDRRIQIHTIPRKGPGAARNHALRQARGEWVLFLDADDIILPDHLTKLISTAQAIPDVHIVVSGWRDYSYRKETVGPLQLPLKTPSASNAFRFTSIAYPPWPVGAAIVRRSVFSDDFLWVEQLDNVMSEDTSFWFRLLQYYEPAISPHDGFRYRVGTSGNRNDFENLPRWFWSQQQVHANNLAFARSKGLPVNWRHHESLMRCYLSTWERASQCGAVAVADAALALSSHHLHLAFFAGGWRSSAILLRCFCGLRITASLLRIYHRVRAQVPRRIL